MEAVKQKLADVIGGTNLSLMDEVNKPVNTRLRDLLECLTLLVEENHFIYNASVALSNGSDTIDNM